MLHSLIRTAADLEMLSQANRQANKLIGKLITNYTWLTNNQHFFRGIRVHREGKYQNKIPHGMQLEVFV